MVFSILMYEIKKDIHVTFIPDIMSAFTTMPMTNYLSAGMNSYRQGSHNGQQPENRVDTIQNTAVLPTETIGGSLDIVDTLIMSTPKRGH